MTDKDKFLPWALIIVLSLIWGTSFILMKRGLSLYTPSEVGALRIVSAGLFLLPLALARSKRLRKRDVKKLFIVGMLGSFFPAFLFAYGQTGVISSVAGMLNSLTPIIVMSIGVLFFKQRLKVMTAVGLLLGLMGTLLLLFSGSGGLGQLNAYALFIVLAVICYSINLNFVKYYLAGLSAVTITSVALAMVMPFAAIYLFGFTPFFDVLVSSEDGVSKAGYIILLGVVGTAIALILFNKLVQISTPLFTSLVTYFIPVVAILWGLFDGETLLATHFIGLVIITAGVYLVNKSKN